MANQKLGRNPLAMNRIIVWESTSDADLATSPTITAGDGAPSASLPKGSLYLRSGGTGAAGILYIATDSAGTWQSLGAAVTAGATDIAISDNAADAFKVSEGSNDYINVDTQNGTETVTLGNPTTNPFVQVAGTGDFAVNGEIRNSRLCKAAITVSDATGGATDASVDIDIQTLGGQNVGAQKAVRVRFYDASRNVLDGTASTLTLAATTGTIVDEPGSGDSWAECLTDATGNLSLTVTNSADATIYVTVEATGNAAGSGQGCVIAESIEQTITWSA